MGVTIHYRGKMNPKIKVKEFYILTSLICKEFGWQITDMQDTEQKGHVFVVTPHENCEMLIFRLTPEGMFSDHCKTQFAPIEIHKQIISLFDQVKIKFSELIVQDEGGFWETRKEAHLIEQLTNCYLAIEEEKAANPDYYGPVKTEEGRIVDLVKEDESDPDS